MIDILPATALNVEYVAAHLRPHDEREIRTSTQMEPVDAMILSAELSEEVYAVHPVLDGGTADPVAIFGVTTDPNDGSRGVVWLMSTPMLLVTSRDILKEAPKWLNKWSLRFPNGLHNVIDARNLQHLTWCKRMGFKFIGVYSVHGFKFIHANRTCAIQSHSH